MLAAIADTHALIWYLAVDARLSATAKTFMDEASRQGNTIGLSSITFVEIVYLVEKGRIPAGRFTQLADALNDPTNLFVEMPVDLQIARALARVDVSKVPDMPDRIITATALARGIPLISRDAKIQVSGITTIW